MGRIYKIMNYKLFILILVIIFTCKSAKNNSNKDVFKNNIDTSYITLSKLHPIKDTNNILLPIGGELIFYTEGIPTKIKRVNKNEYYTETQSMLIRSKEKDVRIIETSTKIKNSGNNKNIGNQKKSNNEITRKSNNNKKSNNETTKKSNNETIKDNDKYKFGFSFWWIIIIIIMYVIYRFYIYYKNRMPF